MIEFFFYVFETKNDRKCSTKYSLKKYSVKTAFIKYGSEDSAVKLTVDLYKY